MRTYWFENPFLFGSTTLPVLLEQLEVLWENVCFWNKVELFLAHPGLQTREVSPEAILPTY